MSQTTQSQNLVSYSDAPRPGTNTLSLQELRAQQLQSQTARAGFETAADFALLEKLGKVFATSTIVPKDYRNNLANCVIALDMAFRMKAAPMAVLQNLYIIYGKPAWSSAFMIATFNQCGRYTAIRYEFIGKPGEDNYGCRAVTTEKATGLKIEGPVISMGMAKAEGWLQKEGSKWKTMPGLMLRYRAAAWLIRTTAPEITMGLQTEDELQDTFDLSQQENKHFELTMQEVEETVKTPAPVQTKEQAPAKG